MHTTKKRIECKKITDMYKGDLPTMSVIVKNFKQPKCPPVWEWL